MSKPRVENLYVTAGRDKVCKVSRATLNF